MDLQEETADVLGTLIRFNTVNPPGNERECQEWLKAYLEEAGFECELAGTSDERPNLVARLRGEVEGPVLGYLSHVDTVLASPEDWSRDPWSGELHDGFVWGRGALDMKSQTAAEAVAGAALARDGWRPPRGELKIISVADEEVGGLVGAQWLTQERPDLARVDMLLNEGAGDVMPYGDRRLYGVCCAEKGTFRFAVRASGRAGHASIPAMTTTRCSSCSRSSSGSGAHPSPTTSPTRRAPSSPRSGSTPPTPVARSPRSAGSTSGSRRWSSRRSASPSRRRSSRRRARSTWFRPAPSSRSTAACPPGWASEETMVRVREALGDSDGVEVEFLEEVIGNSSPVDSPLMDAIRDWIGEAEPGAEVVPTALPAFTDSRWFRAAFPDCVAYGFFPHKHMTLYDTWPLIHGADERIDVRDLGFAARFFHELPRRLLA